MFNNVIKYTEADYQQDSSVENPRNHKSYYNHNQLKFDIRIISAKL